MEEKYSARAAIVIKNAKDLAILHNNPQVTDIHVAIALLEQEQTPLDQIFDYFSCSKAKIIVQLKEALSKLDSKPGLKSLYYSREYQRLILQAKEISQSLYQSTIGSLALFLALFKLDKTPSQHFLMKANLEYDKVWQRVSEFQDEHQLNEKYPKGITEVLKQYGSDLTEEAREGHLDPVIGMDDEIHRLIQILCRRVKNNPILVGEPGVGKTAIVEGLAQRIVRQDVPEMLRNRTIFSLKMSDVIAGSKLRGEFEEKLQEILDIVSNSNRRIIVFIDEIHTVIGTGSSSGGMDSANILKPMLARGKVNVIGATTTAEYSKYIRKDGALERRFQKIMVQEPSVENTISILRGIKSKYEAFHGLRIKDEALVASATLSERYVGDRYLPDKAIDILDEACAKVRTEIDAMPLALDELKRRILQLQMEKVLLEEDESDNEGLILELISTIDDLTQKLDQELEIWQSEKRAMQELRQVRKEIERIELRKEEASRENDFEDIIQLTHVQLPKLREKSDQLLNQSYKYNIIEEVNQDHIAEIIAKMTGIPLSELDQDEVAKLLTLEERLKQKVVGQDENVKILANSILRARSGLKAKDKPIASYLFIGPTGVGKTYLAKVLTATLYQNPSSLIHLDMSEYMDKNSISKLIGSPPGYVGYDEGGQLTEKVMNQPYSVILFDEIEKANPQIFNILLQMLDEGRLTDNKGRVVDFSNCVILLTSNLGSQYFQEHDVLSKEVLQKVLLEYFSPEFLNRLDGILSFRRLDRVAVEKIMELYLEQLASLLEQEVEIVLTPQAKAYVIDISNYQEYGSREVIRVIKDQVEVVMAMALLKHQLPDKGAITIDVDQQGEFFIQA